MCVIERFCWQRLAEPSHVWEVAAGCGKQSFGRELMASMRRGLRTFPWPWLQPLLVFSLLGGDKTGRGSFLAMAVTSLRSLQTEIIGTSVFSVPLVKWHPHSQCCHRKSDRQFAVIKTALFAAHQSNSAVHVVFTRDRFSKHTQLRRNPP